MCGLLFECQNKLFPSKLYNLRVISTNNEFYGLYNLKIIFFKK